MKDLIEFLCCLISEIKIFLYGLSPGTGVGSNSSFRREEEDSGGASSRATRVDALGRDGDACCRSFDDGRARPVSAVSHGDE